MKYKNYANINKWMVLSLFIIYSSNQFGLCIHPSGEHQGMDRPGVWQVPEGSGEQVKMDKDYFKVICGAPATLAVKGLMMM